MKAELESSTIELSKFKASNEEQVKLLQKFKRKLFLVSKVNYKLNLMYLKYFTGFFIFLRKEMATKAF